MTDEIVHGTGNVFADLGLPDAAERQTRTRLALAINERLAARELTPDRAAVLLGVSEAKVSGLLGYRLDGFSVGELRGFLKALDQHVEIVTNSFGL